MGHARLALFSSTLLLVFLLTLLALCSAVPAPAPTPTPTLTPALDRRDFVVTVHGKPTIIRAPGDNPFGGGAFGGGPGFGGGGGKGGNQGPGGKQFGGGGGGDGNPFDPFPPPSKPTTTQKPPATPTPPPQPPSTPTPPPPPPAPPPAPPTSKAPAPTPPANAGSDPSTSSKASSAGESSSKKSASASASGHSYTIPGDLSTGTSAALPNVPSASDPAATSAGASAVSASSSSSHKSALLAGILVPIILLLLLGTAAVIYKRRRDRAREAENDAQPTSQWLGGGSGGAWSRLDMASRYDLASPAPSSHPNTLVIAGRTLGITEFTGEAMSVQTFSTPPASSSGHMHSESGELYDHGSSSSVVGTLSTAAPTDGHSVPEHGATAPYAYWNDAFASAAGHTTTNNTARTDDGHSIRSRGPRTSDGHDHGSIFAASPFESAESPLHWQNEPALADSRATSLDMPVAVPASSSNVPPVPAIPLAMRARALPAPPVLDDVSLRGSTLLAYDRDSRAVGVPDEFNPRNSELV